VFDRFRQADSTTTRSYSGLGLGLAIVHHIVKLHHGDIRAESEGLDKGSTFTVTLPLVQPISPSATVLESQLENQLDCQFAETHFQGVVTPPNSEVISHAAHVEEQTEMMHEESVLSAGVE
jgi:hypothetical protein